MAEDAPRHELDMPPDLREIELMADHGMDPDDIPGYERLLIWRIQRAGPSLSAAQREAFAFLDLAPDHGRERPLTAREALDNLGRALEIRSAGGGTAA